jgi:hypothetical protein
MMSKHARSVARDRTAAVLFCLWVLFAAPRGLAAEPEEAEAGFRRAAASMLARMKAGNRAQREYSLAVVPFVDADCGLTRKIGVDFAQAVERNLVARAPRWLRVQNRILLGNILKEHKLSLLGIVKGKATAGVPKQFVESAQFLVIGSVVWPRRSTIIGVEWRLVSTRTNRVLAADRLRLKMRPEFHDRERFVDPGPDAPEAARVPAVTDIKIAVTAQRAGPFGGGIKTWTVPDGGTLQSRDQFRLELSPDANAYLYVFCHGSDGSAEILYPPPPEWIEGVEQQQHVKMVPVERDPFARAFWVYHVPGEDKNGGRYFYQLDNTPGRNTLYIVAHRTKPKGVHDICQQLGRARNEAHRQAILRDAKLDHVETFHFDQIKPPPGDKP